MLRSYLSFSVLNCGSGGDIETTSQYLFTFFVISKDYVVRGFLSSDSSLKNYDKLFIIERGMKNV